MRFSHLHRLIGVLCLVLFFSTSLSYARDLSGTITDDNTGEPLFGAAVSVVGMQVGVFANSEGEWTLTDLPEDSLTINVLMTGYHENRVVVPPDESIVHIKMKAKMFQMGEVVTTATRTEQLYEDVPVKTEVVQKRRINAVEEPDLYGVLQYSPGVRVENNCQNCGFTQLRMLGLEGGYSQVLVNGRPIVSTMAGVYGLQQFPDEMIEQVEIVKGGGSALYGADAIGGVVNLKMRHPSRNRSGANYTYRTVGSHTRSELGFVSEMVTHNERFGMFLFGSARSQNGYDHNDDGFTDISEMKGGSVGYNMYYKTRRDGTITANLHHIQEDRRGGDRLKKPPHQANIAEAAESARWGGDVTYTQHISNSLQWEGNYAFALANRDTYYGAEQDPNAYGTTDNPTHLYGTKLSHTTDTNELVGGIEYMTEHLKDEAVSYNRVIDDEYDNIGVFLQDQHTFAERYTVIGGARVDKHSLLDDPIVSPRASGLMKLNREWSLRANVSTGFKPPKVFDEDLHITQVGGEGQIIRNATKLTEERSLSYSGTLDYMGSVGTQLLMAGVTGFHTTLSDQFQLVEIDDPSTSAFEFERRNGDGLTVSGIELQAGYKPVRVVEIHGSFTMQRDKLDSPEPDFGSTRMFRTPEQYGNVITYFDPHPGASLFIGANHTGSMLAPHYAGYIANDRLETTDPFTTFDIGMNYEIRARHFSAMTKRLKLGVKNITDEFQDDLDQGIDRDAGYIYGPATPRMFYVGMEVGI